MFQHTFLPPDPRTPAQHLGTWRRLLPVSLERMFENALDWEHLPHQHSSSFSDIRLEDAGAWGWRAWVTDPKGRDSQLELALDRSSQRWITRTLDGQGKGAEIWSHVLERAPRELMVTVDFFAPGVPDDQRRALGEAYARVYERLYDEDVAMMTGRQEALDQRHALREATDTTEVRIPIHEIAAQGMDIALGTRLWHVQQVDEVWACWPSHCPHQAGPLALTPSGDLHCPWHGYRFDLHSGACTTGHPCSLGRRPELAQDGDLLVLRLPRASSHIC